MFYYKNKTRLRFKKFKQQQGEYEFKSIPPHTKPSIMYHHRPSRWRRWQSIFFFKLSLLKQPKLTENMFCVRNSARHWKHKKVGNSSFALLTDLLRVTMMTPSIIGMNNTVTVVRGTKEGMTAAHCGRSGCYSGKLCRRGNTSYIMKAAWEMKRRA